MNYYQTLEVNPQATQQEIKQAYRRLVKLFHPDTQTKNADRDKIIQINAAYEILSNPRSRRSYDLNLTSDLGDRFSVNREQRTARAQREYQRYRQAGRAEDIHHQRWLEEVYVPTNRLIFKILNPLNAEIDSLAGDPFDDELISTFQTYLEHCRQCLQLAQQTFASQPNPSKLAEVAVNLYYCLNQIDDGIKELEWFVLNYDDRHLHTGQEIFRIARRLHRQVQAAAKFFV
ncbi:DnaJ domain-containing protein [Pleurocapsales cyanobacterium LEGE 06147]|nr:DnaJ domain-containing protein [Pleurocapsales cyanobacterium LEGE 06147]